MERFGGRFKGRGRRFVAEWEEQAAVIVAMPHEDSDWAPYLAEAQEKYREIIAAIARFERVIVLFKNEHDVEDLRGQKNVLLAPIATNDTWCRDFMPLSVRQKNRVELLDFTFNAWGLKFAANLDNTASLRLFETGILQDLLPRTKLKKKRFILEGGSVESSGAGLVLTTTNCLLSPNRNDLKKSKITKKVKKFLGAEAVLWLESGFLRGDDTDSHIDNLARFVRRDCVVYLKCEDENDEHFAALAAMERELEGFAEIYGLNLVPLTMPSAIIFENSRLPASYVNFLIINGAVLLPIFGDKRDRDAILTMSRLFSNREIIPIDSRILLRQGGGLHCLSMQIAR